MTQHQLNRFIFLIAFFGSAVFADATIHQALMWWSLG
jgi:hypothetical protein